MRIVGYTPDEVMGKVSTNGAVPNAWLPYFSHLSLLPQNLVKEFITKGTNLSFRGHAPLAFSSQSVTCFSLILRLPEQCWDGHRARPQGRRDGQLRVSPYVSVDANNILAFKSKIQSIERPLRRTKDGVRIEILLNATARRNPNGDIIGVVGIGQDVSAIQTHPLDLQFV